MFLYLPILGRSSILNLKYTFSENSIIKKCAWVFYRYKNAVGSTASLTQIQTVHECSCWNIFMRWKMGLKWDKTWSNLMWNEIFLVQIEHTSRVHVLCASTSCIALWLSTTSPWQQSLILSGLHVLRCMIDFSQQANMAAHWYFL